MTPGPPRCADVASAAGDPGEGTAPPAQQWFLVEHPGPWDRLALTGSGLDADAVAALSGWARREGGRVVLIRRPGRAARGAGPRRWFHVDSRPGREAVRVGELDAEHELVGVVGALDTQGATPGEPFDGSLHLVCAHGRHDTCCAVRGRPLAAALEVDDPGRTWESSHIGGCRFAAALVLLPHGYTFGPVPAGDGPQVARDYRKGLLDPRYLRGRTTLAPAVQAAQHHARAATGELGVNAFAVVRATEDAGLWRVVLAEPACTVVLRERRVPAGRPLTCAATKPGVMRVFDLVELSTAPPRPSSTITA